MCVTCLPVVYRMPPFHLSPLFSTKNRKMNSLLFVLLPFLFRDEHCSNKHISDALQAHRPFTYPTQKMTGWSEDFEQRLQTVIQSGPGLNANAFPSPVCRLDDILDLDPESTVQSTQYYRADAAAQRPVAPSDPTSAFFESIRTQGHPDRSSSSGSRSASYYAVGGSGGSGGRGQQALQHSNLSSARGLFTPTAQMIRASSPPVDVFERPGVQELEGIIISLPIFFLFISFVFLIIFL